MAVGARQAVQRRRQGRHTQRDDQVSSESFQEATAQVTESDAACKIVRAAPRVRSQRHLTLWQAIAGLLPCQKKRCASAPPGTPRGDAIPQRISPS